MGRPTCVNVPREEFVTMCHELAAVTAGWQPDLVVGIERGGARVAELMLDRLGRPRYVTVRLQRPATRAKSLLPVGPVLRRLPAAVTARLRWLEVEARERVLSARPEARPRATGEDGTTLAEDLRSVASPERVLLVDDTIDSGRTVNAVRRMVNEVAPDAEVRVAVLASTWRRPPVTPDYCLRDRTMLVLPWSLDAAA